MTLGSPVLRVVTEVPRKLDGREADGDANVVRVLLLAVNQLIPVVRHCAGLRGIVRTRAAADVVVMLDGVPVFGPGNGHRHAVGEHLTAIRDWVHPEPGRNAADAWIPIATQLYVRQRSIPN